MDTTRKNCSKSGCQKSMLKSDCKVCSVCRKVTYCSRECQKADWPIHKPTCDAGGSLSVPSVTLQIVREAIDRDKELMSDIDMIAAAALQLHNFPERARTHTVILFCRMESGETGPLKDDIRAKLDNWRTADKIPTTFQLSRAEAWPETQLKPPIREKINAEFMAFVNEFFKRGILPSDNVMPFRIVWTFDTPSGNIVTHAVLVYRVFFRQNMASLRHIFDEYAVDGCLNALVNNFNRKLIADPKRMDKLSAIFRNVNSTLERVPLTTPVTIFCTNPACEKPMTKSEGKFCSACKLNMYCSRECQKAHWPIHKQMCGTQSRGSENKIFKVITDKLIPDDVMFKEISFLSGAALQLHDYPQRADTHTLLLFCRLEDGESGEFKEMLGPILQGWPSRTTNRIPKLFQLSRAEICPRADLSSDIVDNINKCYETFMERGMSKDNFLPFPVIWTMDGEGLEAGFAIGYARFNNENIDNLRHFFQVYGGENGVNSMIKEFNMSLIKQPERTKKMVVLTDKHKP